MRSFRKYVSYLHVIIDLQWLCNYVRAVEFLVDDTAADSVSVKTDEEIKKRDVPVSGTVENFAEYDTVYIGFPIWYGCAPNVVNTFCSAYDWTGKTVHIFATSGGSGIGRTSEKLQPYVKGADIADAKLVHSAEEI